METLKNYQKIICETIQEIADIIRPQIATEVQTIFDHEHGHYLLYMVGWENERRDYVSIMHIDLKKNEKVYIQHDGTDLKIALVLAEKGIPKSSIVIGYRAPSRRNLLPEFALE